MSVDSSHCKQLMEGRGLSDPLCPQSLGLAVQASNDTARYDSPRCKPLSELLVEVTANGTRTSHWPTAAVIAADWSVMDVMLGMSVSLAVNQPVHDCCEEEEERFPVVVIVAIVVSSTRVGETDKALKFASAGVESSVDEIAAA